MLEIGKQHEGEDGHGNGENEYKCSVFVANEEIVRVDGGVSREEVETRAAERAVAILKSRKERKDDKGRMGVDGYEVMEGGVPRDDDTTMGLR